MRVMLFILLLLNIIYFAWQFIQSSSDDVINVSQLKDIEPIVLLSEVKVAKEELAKEKVAREEAKIAAVKARKIEREKISASASTKRAAASVETKKTKKSVVSIVASSNVTREKKTAVVKDEKRLSSKVVSSPGQCFTVGPFRDLKKLRGLTRAIKSYVVEADFRGKEEKMPPLYWVYTAAEKTKKLTLETAARLRSKNINDFYIINSNKKINSISLGRFRNKKGVRKLVKKLEKWGFDIIVEVVRKKVTIYWLDYRLAEGRHIPKSVFVKYRPSKKQTASRLSRQCDP